MSGHRPRVIILSVCLLLSSLTAHSSMLWYDSSTNKVTERALGLYAAMQLAQHHAIETEDLKLTLQRADSVDEVDAAHTSVLDQLITRFSLGQLPTSADPLWDYPEPDFDLLKLRYDILSAPALLPALAALLPRHSDYQALVELYHKQPSTLTEPDKLEFRGFFKPGQMHKDIRLVRERLSWLGYPAKDEVTELAPRLYDEVLAGQIRQFQADHGLEADAIIGPNTLSWLNYSSADRKALIAAVLERWRWLPRDLGENYLLVSIPGFEVRYFDKGKLAERHISISGRPSRPTRSFRAQVEQFVVNPTWTVPRRILMRDLVPKILANPDYLTQQGMQAERLYGDLWQPVANDSIDWATLGWDDKDVRLVQAAGEKNALGQIKFHMPNSHAIYLHDTPSKELFADASRAFSSGCIRVEGIADLAKTLMRERVDLLESSLTQSETQWLRLPKSIPVYLVYNRAWVDSHGRLQLRDDVYNADSQLLAVLGSKLKNAQLAER